MKPSVKSKCGHYKVVANEHTGRYNVKIHGIMAYSSINRKECDRFVEGIELYTEEELHQQELAYEAELDKKHRDEQLAIAKAATDILATEGGDSAPAKILEEEAQSQAHEEAECAAAWASIKKEEESKEIDALVAEAAGAQN